MNRKNPNFSKNLSFAYIHEHIYTQRTYIHTYIHFYKNAKKDLKKGHINRYTHIHILIHIHIIKHINVQKKHGGIRGQCRP